MSLNDGVVAPVGGLTMTTEKRHLYQCKLLNRWAIMLEVFAGQENDVEHYSGESRSTHSLYGRHFSHVRCSLIPAVRLHSPHKFFL